MAKTKSVGGRDHPAADFAYVGDPEDVSTWHLPIFDADHVRAALGRFNQTQLPADAKAGVARKILAASKKFGIDASGFAEEHKALTSEAKSNEQIMAELDHALVDKFGLDSNGYRQYSLCETFPDYLIARGPDGDLYQISYSIDGEDVTLGDPRLVETAYVPVQQAAKFLAAEASAGEDGWTWPVQIMEAGWARGEIDGEYVPHYFPRDVVAQVAEAANGGRFRRRHPQGIEGDGSAYPELTAGWTSEAGMAENAAQAKVHLLKSETKLREQLLAAREAGKLDLYGVSVFAYFGFRAGSQDGKKCLLATSLRKYVGLDLCAEAGAGGRILPYAASRDVLAEISDLQKSAIKVRGDREAVDKVSPGSTGRETGSPQGAGRISGGAMKNTIRKVLEALRKHDAGRAAEFEKEFAAIAEDKHVEFMARVSEALAIAMEHAQPAKKDEQAPEILAKAQEALAEAKKIQFANFVEGKLAEAKLPVPAAQLVREHLEGRSGDSAMIDAEIKRTREAFAAFANVGKASGATVEVGRESVDKVQLAIDAMLGVREALADKNVHPFRGIREAYVCCTGDRDLKLSQGGFYRVSEAIATADFPNILLNSLTKRLIQDFQTIGLGGIDRLYTTTSLGDYKTQDRVRLGYLGDLPTVAEAGVYTELVKPTDEKVSYAPLKKGGLLTISEETIRNDDLNKIAQFPERMARAGIRTLKQYITDFFVNNPLYDPDGLAWFAAGHNNLGAAALSIPELNAREVVLLKQTEKDSAKRMGLPLEWIMVPVDLKAVTFGINNSDVNNPGPGIEEANPWYQRFGARGEQIIVNELLADTNDWFGGSLPATAPFLEIGFLDGVQTPQIFLANLATQGTQFTNDQLQYKVKFVFGGKPIDFRPVFKNVVP